jgi:hypothetical protein
MTMKRMRFETENSELPALTKINSNPVLSIFGLLLLLSNLLGCIGLKTMNVPVMPADAEARERIYQEYRIDCDQENAVHSIEPFNWISHISPNIKVQGMKLSGVDALKLEDYYEGSGDIEAAKIARLGNDFYIAGIWCIAGGAAVAAGEVYEITQHNHFGWEVGAADILIFSVAFWLQHHATTAYYYPSAQEFNSNLRKTLNLSVIPINAGSGVRVSTNY